MNEFEFFGCIICVNLVKLMRIKEGFFRLVWLDDDWLKKFFGKIFEENKEEEGLEFFKVEIQEGEFIVKKVWLNFQVYMDIKIGNKLVGCIQMFLCFDVVFMIVENFCCLCIYEKGFGFKGSSFYCIIFQFMCQGGDFINYNGIGGKFIYGKKFDDENFIFKYMGLGLFFMVNFGLNINGFQFFLICDKIDWLDGKYVVFGEVIEGLDVLW